MRFTDRDGHILETIQTCDGVLARRQIKELFWPGESWRAMHRRLAKLVEQGYIAKPTLEMRRYRAIPEPIVWIDWRGSLFVAGKTGIKVEPPKSPNETQLRKLQKNLRKDSFRWMREPRWSQLEHDLAVVDVHLAFQKAANSTTHLKIEEWVNESAFRTDMDVIEFTISKPMGGTKKCKRGVCPDGAFVLSDRQRQERGEPNRARFLLELDMASHDNASFGLEKAAAGAAYIKSTAYRNRFGSNSGRWLVVTTGKVRMKNLIKQAKQWAGEDAHLFFFSTMDLVAEQDPISSPIWFIVEKDTPASLLSG